MARMMSLSHLLRLVVLRLRYVTYCILLYCAQRTDYQKPGGSRQPSFRPHHAQVRTAEMASTVSSSWPPSHPNNDARVHKRRRQTQKVIPAREQSITSNPKLAAYAFSEEKLFELLIGKIRQREENELAAADIRQQLETQKAELTEENQNLKRPTHDI